MLLMQRQLRGIGLRKPFYSLLVLIFFGIPPGGINKRIALFFNRKHIVQTASVAEFVVMYPVEFMRIKRMMFY